MFWSLRAELQVFGLFMLFLCVILHTMWSGKSLQLLCILPLGMLCLSAISMMFVKIMLTVSMLVGMVVLAKTDSVFRELCSVGSLVVGKRWSAWLACSKNSKSVPIAGGNRFRHNLHSSV